MLAIIMIPAYPKSLLDLLKKPVAVEDEVVREMRLQDSIETTYDPNDTPLEIAKNLQANLGPIDTEAEKKSQTPIDDHAVDEDESSQFRP